MIKKNHGNLLFDHSIRSYKALPYYQLFECFVLQVERRNDGHQRGGKIPGSALSILLELKWNSQHYILPQRVRKKFHI